MQSSRIISPPSGNRPTHSVLVVDDHYSIAYLIGQFVRDLPGFRLSGLAHDAGSAMAAFQAQPADVVILDLGLPDRNGLDLVAEIRAISPPAKILVFSALATPELLRQAMRLEVAGFLEKTAPVDQLEAALREVVAGKIALSAGVGGMLREIISGHREERQLEGRQLVTLRLLAAGHSVKEIAAHHGLSIPGVYKAISRMKEITGSRTAMELVLKARARGLLD